MASPLDVTALGAYIREQREAAEVSLRQLAKSAGVSNPYLSQIERGLKKPSAEILGQIASALRISAETLYVRAGLLEPRAGNAAVTEALAADDTLTVERIAGEAGAKVEFTDVLMVGDKVGAPTVAGAKVVGSIVKQARGPHLIVFKKRRRQNSRRKNGHRQDLTVVKIEQIVA